MNNNLLTEMEVAGLSPAHPLSISNSGEIQRFQVASDKAGTKNGWLVSYYNTKSAPIHVFGSWKQGVSHSFIEGFENTYSYEAKLQIQLARKNAQIEKEKSQNLVAEECKKIWHSLPPANEHEYLSRKQIKSFNLRQLKGRLVIPLLSFDWKLQSLQFINTDGTKTFKTGGKVAGSFYPIGFESFDDSDVWIICEGYATGASIFEASNIPTLVSFNANNIKRTALALRSCAPKSKIIIAADNDRFTNSGNVGVAKAESAAREVGAFVVIPHFSSPVGTDFNDLALQEGLPALSEIFKEVAA